MTTATTLPDAAGLELDIPTELATDTQASLRTTLEPIFGEAGPLCVKARDIVVTDADDKAGMKLAGDTRKAIKRVRTEAERKRKELKEDALRTGQAIDGIFRQFRQALEAHEAYLQEQETYAERMAAQKRALLKAERDAKLREYDGDPAHYNTGDMTDEAFEACLAGVKTQYEQAKAAAEQAERERIAREKAEAEERERVRQENERLRKEAAEAEAKARAEREKHEATLQAEREAREKAECEAREQREAQERAEAARKAEEARKAKEAAEAKEQAERAPDRDKLASLADSMAAIEWPECSSMDGKLVVAQVRTTYDGLVSMLREKSANL